MSNDTFFSRFYLLCRQNGTSPNAVGRQIGASSGSITAWKHGAEPRPAMLQKIADYFDVTVDYLLCQAPTPLPEQITNDQLKFALFGGDRPISDAMLEEVRRFAQFIKSERP